MIKKLMAFFNKEKEIPRGKTYNMSDYRGWGNSISWTDWPKLQVHGHLSSIPDIGDVLTCEFKSGNIGEFQFVKVDRCRDPQDMFFASVKYLGGLPA